MGKRGLSTQSSNQAAVEWFHLWGQFLRVSPSYDLARRFRAGELSADYALPADFDRVLAVYDDLGDIHATNLLQWWRRVGFQHFGYEGETPELVRLGVVSHDDDDDQLMRLRSSIRDYLTEEWLDQGQPTAIVAAIPIGTSKAQIMKQFAAMLDGVTDEEIALHRRLAGGEAKYRLSRTRFQRQTAFRYLRCLMVRAMMPDATLWQVGAKSKISSHSRWFDTSSKQLDPAQTDNRNTLKILTSRALHRGHMIAENAARGIFPSYAKCEHAVQMDWGQLPRQRQARFRHTDAGWRTSYG